MASDCDRGALSVAIPAHLPQQPSAEGMRSTEVGYEGTPLEDLVSTIGGQELADLMQDEPSDATRRSTETDAMLHSRCLENSGENMTAEDAQQLLHRRASLVAAGLMRETPSIEVDLDESCGMHFLINDRAKETPLFNLAGPSSGMLYPGDDSTFPGVALLKISASKNTAKIGKDPAVTARWTDEHARYSITSWREVQLGLAHGRTEQLVGSLQKHSERPKKDEYDDIKPKISLIVFHAREAAKKRQRSGCDGPSSDRNIVGSSLSVTGDAKVEGDIDAGGTIRGKLESSQADFAEYMPRHSLAEELNKGDVVALVGGPGEERATISRSARGSATPEWRVVTTDPLLLGNTPADGEEETVVGIVFAGQVPVRVVGAPPVDAYLVPSGEEDGRARELASGERPVPILGKVIDARVRSGRIGALVQQGLGSELYVAYFEQMISKMDQENEQKDRATAQAYQENLRLSAENERLRSADEAHLRVAVEEEAAVEVVANSVSAARASAADEAAKTALRGEWPWDIPGKLDFDGRRVVTPSVALLNRMVHKHKLFQSSGGSSSGIVTLGDTTTTYCYTEHVTIKATGEVITAKGAGPSEWEAQEDALRRLLEVDGCKLMQLLDEAERQITEADEVAVAEQGSSSNSPRRVRVPNASADSFGKQRLNTMVMHLCRLSQQMMDLQNVRLVTYDDFEIAEGLGDFESLNLATSADPSHPTFRRSASLPLCEGQPVFLGALAQTRKASEHTAAERAIAFVERVLKSLSDISYALDFAKLSELLADLRQMRHAHEASATSSSFKELLHVIAMRIKRPSWNSSGDPRDFIGDLEIPDEGVWRNAEFMALRASSTTYLSYTMVPPDAGSDFGLSEHGTPLEISRVSFVRFDGAPTFIGEPAAGRRAAEQSAAEAALAFIFDRVVKLRSAA